MSSCAASSSMLPEGFVRIRHFGFLANCRRSTLLPLCFAALGTTPSQTEPETSTAQESRPLLALPQAWWAHGSDRTPFRCSNPALDAKSPFNAAARPALLYPDLVKLYVAHAA